MSAKMTKISNDFDEHRPAPAAVLEQHENPFADTEYICESDDDRSFQGVADDSDSELELKPESPLRKSSRNIDSAMTAQDAVTTDYIESPFSDSLSDDGSDTSSLRSPISLMRASLSESESDSDSDDEDEDDVCTHCSFLPGKPYLFRRPPPPTPATQTQIPIQSILSSPRIQTPSATPAPLLRRLTFKSPKIPTPSPHSRPTVHFTTSQTKSFSSTTPTHHISCIPPVPQPLITTPSRLREHSLRLRRRTHQHATSAQVLFRRVTSPDRTSSGAPDADASLIEVVEPFSVKLQGAPSLDVLLGEIAALWPDAPVAEGTGVGELWPPRWARFRLVEGGGKRGKGDAKGALVDCKVLSRVGGLKRWFQIKDAEGAVSLWDRGRVMMEYERLLNFWRLAEEERLEGLKRRENGGGGGGMVRKVLGLGKGEESGEVLRRRFAKYKVTPVVELLWE